MGVRLGTDLNLPTSVPTHHSSEFPHQSPPVDERLRGGRMGGVDTEGPSPGCCRKGRKAFCGGLHLGDPGKSKEDTHANDVVEADRTLFPNGHLGSVETR